MVLFAHFDEYSVKARLFPGLIAALPLSILAVVYLPNKPLLALLGAAGAAGAMFLLASFVRELGKRAEQGLLVQWDGLPTTALLRHRTPQNNVLFTQRRQALEHMLDERLPTESEELASPKLADDAYIAATRRLISRVRERKLDFPRVHEENISYGFARNMLGIKKLAITLVSLAMTLDLVLLYRDGVEAIVVVALAAHIVLLLFWALFVRSGWVRRAGTSYAERLFETLDSGRLWSSEAS